MSQKNGRLAIVTGAAGGIGLSIAERLARSGYAVAIWDYAGEKAMANALAFREKGFNAVGGHVDVADTGHIEGALADAVAAFGAPYVLVNNAGIRHRFKLEDLPRASWEREIATNLTGAFLCTQAVGRLMLQAGAGVIVNLCSAASTFGHPGRGAYSPSKAGLLGLTNVTAVEWGPRGIRCNAVAPGMIATAVHDEVYKDVALRNARQALVPLGRLGDASDIADVVDFLVSDAARFINGVNIPIDGGFQQTLMALVPSPPADGPVVQEAKNA